MSSFVSRFVNHYKKEGNMAQSGTMRSDSACVVIEGCVLSKENANEIRTFMRENFLWMKKIVVSVVHNTATVYFRPTERLWELNIQDRMRSDDVCGRLRTWLGERVTDETKIYTVSPHVAAR